MARIGWPVVAALQLALPGAATWAEARLDAASALAVAHVESHTTDSCTRIHPPDCALCHFLTTPLAPRRPVALRLDGAAQPVPLAERTGPALTLARPHPHPRAPPALS